METRGLQEQYPTSRIRQPQGMAKVGVAFGPNLQHQGIGTSTSGQEIGASAIFDANGSKLVITLENTWNGTGGTKDDAATLVGVFFSGLDGLSLSEASAIVPAGEKVWRNTTGTLIGDSGLNVGGEWGGYKTFATAINGSTAGISSSGLSGLFSKGNLNGRDLNEQTALGGADYGIVSADYDASNANYGLKKYPVVNNSTVFTFMYSGNLEKLADVPFVYGTLPNSYVSGVKTKTSQGGTPTSGGETTPVPDNANTLMLLGSSLLGLGFMRRKEYQDALETQNQGSNFQGAP